MPTWAVKTRQWEEGVQDAFGVSLVDIHLQGHLERSERRVRPGS